MIVGVCKIKLRIAENMSLKGKRRVLKSIVSQLGNKFNIAVAEVDDNQLWQIATIGVCSISNNSRHINEMFANLMNFITAGRFEVEILDYETEIIPC
ncbi:MAG: DUF503 domain-containing protein [Dehalococcoidia bacterium]|nr:MAG: DUF503 domain-containing protein [Dehalococcoidia bacterium]